MAFRKRVGSRRRDYKRRSYKKRKTIKAHKKSFKKGMTGNIVGIKGAFPENLYTKLRYVQAVSLPDAIFGVYKFRGNSLFDPDFTGTGEQPTYRDQLAILYERYCVLGSKFKVTYAPGQTTLAAQSMIAIKPVTLAGDQTLTTAIDYFSSPMTKSKYARGYASGPTTISMYMSTKQMFGVKDVTDERDLSAISSNNPSMQWLWQFVHGSFDGSTQLSGFRMIVELTYYVKFSRLIELNRS